MDAKELVIVLDKPIDEFDPWEDVIKGIAGCYTSESDRIMLDVLRAVRDRKTFDVIHKEGFIAEFMLYVLAGHGLTEYGTSPRGGWPDPKFEDQWQRLIDKWQEYADKEWGREPHTLSA